MRASDLADAPRPSRVPSFALGVLLAGALGTYGLYAARQAGGCDTWAYLSDSFILRGKDVGLDGSLDPARFPALVPLCYELIHHGVVSLMPPGFPVLLALGGLLHAEFWVSPLLGALSIGFLYETVRRRAGPWIALSFAAIWATLPIVVWGSTQLMSDMAAATFGLVAFVLADGARERAAGAMLGFSFGIRPTNVLLLPALLTCAWRAGGLRRFCFGFGFALFAWSAFAIGRYGGLFPRGYAGNVHEFSTQHVFHQLAFFGKTTLSMAWPIVLLALVEAYRRPRRSAVLLLWSLPFVGLYSLWKYPFQAWWWSRYLLPAYPALFILGAGGVVELSLLVRRAGLAVTPMRALGVLATLLICGRGTTFDQSQGLLKRGFEKGYADDSRRIAEIVPSNSLIGAFNFTGPLRMYARLESFKYDDPDALELVDWATRENRPVYAVIEPTELDTNPRVLELRARFDLEDVAPLTNWSGLMLKRIVPPRRAGRLDLELGTPAARRFLGSGWSGDEFDARERWVWAVGRRSTLTVPLEAGREILMTLRLASFAAPGRQQEVEVAVNGAPVGSNRAFSRAGIPRGSVAEPRRPGAKSD